MGATKTKHFAYLAMLCAMAITLNMIESLYIGAMPFGIRLGLANIIALITIELLGVKDMIIVNIMRVMIGSLLRGYIFGSTFWISFGGVLLSSIVLIIMDKAHASLMFTSVVSAIAHSTGQVFVVMYFYQQAAVAAILPYLFLGSIPTGILTGYVAKMVLKHIKPIKKNIPTN